MPRAKSGKREITTLFEGIIIGIYGNWLISLVDKISFDFFHQRIVITLSFGCLVILVFLGYIRPDLQKRWVVTTLSWGHLLFNFVAFIGEEITNKVVAFLGVGMFLFLVIFICEVERMKFKR